LRGHDNAVIDTPDFLAVIGLSSALSVSRPESPAALTKNAFILESGGRAEEFAFPEWCSGEPLPTGKPMTPDYTRL